MSTFEDTQLWTDYILSNPLYKELSQLKEEGWSNPAGDLYFETRRQTATNPSRRQRKIFYKMTRDIGDALALATGIYNLDHSHPTILDLCMAPGGFSSTTKKHLPHSIIDAVTLHPDDGGYQVMAKDIFRDIVYADITMFAQEMAPDSAIPAKHPDLTKFQSTRPFLENQYDIVFCGGAVGKNHPRAGYRDNCEGPRLTISELVFALNRLKSGGTLVLLLHRVESWDTACLLHAFDECSNIQLFKHQRYHGVKSSFYLVAKNIDLEHDTARLSLRYWKSL